MEVEPIRDPKQISTIRAVLKNSPQGLRDDALFVLGVNTALRVGDLLALRVGDVLAQDGKLRDFVQLTEKKTGKFKKSPINKAAAGALKAHLAARYGSLAKAMPGEPLFKSRKGERAITRQRAHKILSEAAKAIGLANVGTHSLRKTFGYHAFKKSGGNLALIQKLLNHESAAVTLRYIGITREEMDGAVIDLNLG